MALDTLGTTSTADATMAAYDSLRRHGTLVLIGGVRQNLTIPYGDLMHPRLTLRGSWMSDDQTVTTVWNQVRSGLLDLSAVELLTVDLDDPPAALDLAERTTVRALSRDAPGLAHVRVASGPDPRLSGSR
ncbi:hypothetical protein ACLQ28_15280 [Micromonospora sp. DT201]|uniref:hypothetical protein n=1 Tax=Micromonospora sp. DT201 TaxID=3393442 RepID=UPI003CF905F7